MAFLKIRALYLIGKDTGKLNTTPFSQPPTPNPFSIVPSTATATSPWFLH